MRNPSARLCACTICSDAGILEQLTAALQHDRMVVDDEHAGHDSPPTNSGARVIVVLERSIGIST
jgi:hypothetical protein